MQLHLPHGVVDLERGEVRPREGGTTHLTDLERKLLGHLLARDGRPTSREELLVEVWGYAPTTRSRCVDTAVRRLRHKIEPDPRAPRHLVSVHGIGYRLVVERPPEGPMADSVWRQHRDRILGWVAEQVGDAPAPVALFDALTERREVLFLVLDGLTAEPGEEGLNLLYLLNRYLLATTPVDRSLGWVSRALASAGEVRAPVRVRGEIQLAGLLRLVGRHEEAHEALDRALALGPGDDRGFVTAVRATILHTERRHEASLAAYLQAADELEEHHPARAAAYRAEASVQVLRQGRADEAVDLARRATRAARLVGDVRLAARCEGRLGLVLARRGWPWEALPRLKASIDVFREVGDDHQLAFGLLHLAEARLDLGETDAAMGVLAEGEAVALEVEVPALLAQYRRLRGVASVLGGDPQTARELLEEAVRGHEDTERGTCTSEVLGWLAVAYADLGLEEAMFRTLERLADLSVESGFRRAITGVGDWEPDPLELDERLVGRLIRQRARP